MNHSPKWWLSPRTVSVVVDNSSWILPYANTLVEQLKENHDNAILCRSHDEIQTGGIAFFLGCIKITPPEILARNYRNLVVHESDLPYGRGFSPLTWQILEGRNEIPICLMEATNEVDGGPVVYRETMLFEGHELHAELRQKQGCASIELCSRYMAELSPPLGIPQCGEGSYYPRRTPKDSALDVTLTLAEQFNLLRVVDNNNYPAFFELHGQRYELRISKSPRHEMK